MCGSLRNENTGDLMPGAIMSVTRQDGQMVQARWDGFAQQETLQNWQSHGWQAGDLHASGYREGRNWYDVERGRSIRVIVRPVGSRNEQAFKIVTRPATGAEQDVHPRFPATGPRRY